MRFLLPLCFVLTAKQANNTSTCSEYISWKVGLVLALSGIATLPVILGHNCS